MNRTEWLILLVPLAWVIGLLQLVLLLLFVLSLPYLLQRFFQDRSMLPFTILLSTLTLSLALSFRFEFFEHSRAYAAGHNLYALCFLVVGHGLWQELRKERRKQLFLALFWIIFIGISLSWIWHFSTGSALPMRGLLEPFIENKFTEVIFTYDPGGTEEGRIRSRFLGFYPNMSAWTVLLIYFLSDYQLEKSDRLRWFLFLAMFLMLVLTGSRMFVALGLLAGGIRLAAFVPKASLKYFTIAGLVIGFGLSLYLLLYRSGSNFTRAVLYKTTLEFWSQHGFWTGIGIKPRFEALNDTIPYPLGSHSTWLGLLFRGGPVALIIALTAFVLWSKSVLRSFQQRFDHVDGLDRVSVLLLSLLTLAPVTLLEDIDSMALVPCLIGMVWAACQEGLEISRRL